MTMRTWMDTRKGPLEERTGELREIISNYMNNKLLNQNIPILLYVVGNSWPIYHNFDVTRCVMSKH